MLRPVFYVRVGKHTVDDVLLGRLHLSIFHNICQAGVEMQVLVLIICWRSEFHFPLPPFVALCNVLELIRHAVTKASALDAIVESDTRCSHCVVKRVVWVTVCLARHYALILALPLLYIWVGVRN